MTILDDMANLLPWHPEAARIVAATGRDEFDAVAAPDWTSFEMEACALLYHRYVEPAEGIGIPDAAFCSSLGDLPRWVFLEYLTRFCGVVLFGSNDSSLTRLEPLVLCPSCRGWDAPRYFAFSDCLRPIYQAVVDLKRLQLMNRPTHAVVVRTGQNNSGQELSRFYFGLDYRTLPQAPWRRGTVYLYARRDLPQGFDALDGPAGNPDPLQPIRPLAKLNVAPWDWPALGRVHGFDANAQQKMGGHLNKNFPWIGDAEVHPARHWRVQVEEVRTYLESRFDEKLSLERLGRRAGVSSFAILRAFRVATGLSPHEYQTLLRITRARRLLRGGAMIASAATSVGFYDQSHFHRYFRRIVGVTPGDYLRT